MKPSPYQQAVIDWTAQAAAAGGSKALVVEAVAGSGKTTTIVKAAENIPLDDRAVFVAFNKKIADELREKLPAHVEAKTLNSLGFAAFRMTHKRTKLNAYKTMNLADELFGKENAKNVKFALQSLLGKAKSHALHPDDMTPDDWRQLMGRYDVQEGDIEIDLFIRWAQELYEASIDTLYQIDFDDQIWLPVVLELSIPKYDWIIVDEAQDVSHCQRILLERSLATGGKIVAVGDTHQAIYGFRGADSSSMQSIVSAFEADKLPLSVTYRCPRKVVDIAKQYVPEIQSHESAAEGEVLRPAAWTIEQFEASDMIVCRFTAPLISLAYRCISQGKPVTVLGRDIGRGLVSVIEKVAGKKIKDINQFWPKLTEWERKQVEKAGYDDAKIASVLDKVACITVVGLECETVEQLCEAITSIFDDRPSGPTLATVHKSKGLEAPRVFILNPDSMPCAWAKQPWQQEQEMNLIYVAVTRALQTLVYLPLDIVQ